MGVGTVVTQFNLAAVQASDIHYISSSIDKEHIGSVFSRVWDAVADWFCSTNRQEAKKCLFDLYSDSATDIEKMESFEKLKTLAGVGYKDLFQVEDNEDGQVFMLRLDVPDVQNFSLRRNKVVCDTAQIVKELAGDRMKENLSVALAKDIGRGNYSVAGETLKGKGPERLLRFDELLATLDCSEEQKKSITEVCNQSLFGLVIVNATGMPMSPGKEILNYDVRSEKKDESDEHPQITVQARCFKDVAVGADAATSKTLMSQVSYLPSMNKSVDIQIDIIISPDGNIGITKLDYYANKGL